MKMDPYLRRVSLFLLFAGVCSFLCWAIADIIRLEQEISVSNEDVSHLIVKHRLWEQGEKVLFWPKGPRLNHDGDQGPGMLRKFIRTFFGDASPFSFVLCWPGLVAWSSVPIFNHVEAGMAWDKEDDHRGDDHHWARSSSRSSSWQPIRSDAQTYQQRKPRVDKMLGNSSARSGQARESFQRETRQAADESSETPKGNDDTGHSERDNILITLREEDMPSTQLISTEAEIRDDTEFNLTVVNVFASTPGGGRVSTAGPIIHRSPEALHITGKREEVKEVMVTAWKFYKQYAWGFDELDSINLKGSNNHGGLGVTIIDSLDTLYIMGLYDQFNEAAEWVENCLDLSTVRSVTVSEISVRVLGGLLSAYDLSENRLFLDKARELADRLLPAWDTATGIPMKYIDLASGRVFEKARKRSSPTESSTSTSRRASGRTRNPNLNSATNSTTLASARAPGKAWKPATVQSSTLSDIASGQIEFFALARRTGVAGRSYVHKPLRKVFDTMKKIFPSDGLLPTCFSPDSGKPTCSKVTFGEEGGRFYDSLLKLGMVARDLPDLAKMLRGMWEQSMTGLLSLVRKSNPSSFVYIAERSGTDSLTILPKMEEVACLAPGMLALGADDASPELATQYIQTAEKLAETCYFYFPPQASYGSGVIDYYILFTRGQDMTVGSKFPNAFATKTIESYFHLWRKTGERKYRIWAWDIFQSQLDMMSRDKSKHVDSSFMANTLKYMYLLYSPPSVMPREEWVFTTGAHPIKIHYTRFRGNYPHSDRQRPSAWCKIRRVQDFLKRIQEE